MSQVWRGAAPFLAAVGIALAFVEPFYPFVVLNGVNRRFDEGPGRGWCRSRTVGESFPALQTADLLLCGHVGLGHLRVAGQP